METRWDCDKELTRLTHVAVGNIDDNFTPLISWMFSAAPDGKQIALALALDGYAYDESSEIYVLDVDLCASMPDGCTVGQLRRLTHNDVYDGNPTWSPNGNWIVFETWRDYKRTLHKIHPDGTDEQPFLNQDVARVVGDTVDAPAWSPDGSRLAFSMWRMGKRESTSSIVVVDQDGANLRMLLPAPEGAGEDTPLLQQALSWSPDGQSILISLDTDSEKDFAVMGADGTDIRKLPSNMAPQTWLPDSQHIMGACFNSVGPIGTCVVDINTRETFRIGLKHWEGAIWAP